MKMTTISKIALLFICSFIPGAVAKGNQHPLVNISPDGSATLFLPVEVLQDEEVLGQLVSGLTTSFQVELAAKNASGETVTSIARIEVRYQLWEEVYLVSASGLESQHGALALPNLDALKLWWRATGIEVFAPGSLTVSGGYDFKIFLKVIPFSASEQDRARQWVTDATAGPGGVGVGEGPSARGGILNAIVATSIKRKPLLKYRWRIRSP